MPRKRGRKSRNAWGSNDDAGAGRRRLRFWADLHDGKGYTRHSKTIVGTKRDGDLELARIRLEHAEDRPMPTVGEIWERFERPRLTRMVGAGRLARQSLKTYESKWKNHVAPRWADVPVADIRSFDVQTWLMGLTEATGKLCKNVLKQTLDQAMNLDVIPANPADRDFEYGEQVTRDKGIYTLNELLTLWDSCRGTVCEAPFILMAHGGLRVGEACGMRVDNVEFRSGVALIRVEEQLTQDGVKDEPIKTGTKGERYTGIPDPWASRIGEIVRSLPPGAVYLNDRGDGSPRSRGAVSEEWRRCVRETGMRYLPMKDLRASYETNLHWDDDVPLDKASRILGHTTTATTRRSYDRPTDEHLAQLAVGVAKKQRERDKLGHSPD